MIFCVWHISHLLLPEKKCIFQVFSNSLDALLDILGGDVITGKNDVTVTSFHVLSGGTSNQINCFGPWSHHTKFHAFSGNCTIFSPYYPTTLYLHGVLLSHISNNIAFHVLEEKNPALLRIEL